jgi:uncharacterized protein YhbP (UPF0306 family)
MNRSIPEKSTPAVDDALAFLAKHHCISLATCGPAGLWASTVFYVNRGFDLYFLSGANTRHVENIDASAPVAGTVNDDVDDWRSIRGVQLEGRAERVADARRRELLELFALRFPFPEMFWWTDEGTVPRAEQRIYRIRPSRLQFYDHAVADTRVDVPAELLRSA